MFNRLLQVAPVRQNILSFILDCAGTDDIALAAVCRDIRSHLCSSEGYRDRCGVLIGLNPVLCAAGPVSDGSSIESSLQAADWLSARLRGSYADLRSIIHLFCGDPRGTVCAGAPWGVLIHLVPVPRGIALVRDTQNPKHKATGAGASAEQGWRKELSTRNNKIGRKKLASHLASARKDFNRFGIWNQSLSQILAATDGRTLDSELLGLADRYANTSEKFEPDPSAEHLLKLARLARRSALASSGWSTLGVGSTAPLQEVQPGSSERSSGSSGEDVSESGEQAKGGVEAEAEAGAEAGSSSTSGPASAHPDHSDDSVRSEDVGIALNPWSEWIAQDLQFVGLIRAVPVSPKADQRYSLARGASDRPAVSADSSFGVQGSSTINSTASSKTKPSSISAMGIPLPQLKLVLEARDSESPAWTKGFPCISTLHAPCEGVMPPLPPREQRDVRMRRSRPMRGLSGVMLEDAVEACQDHQKRGESASHNEAKRDQKDPRHMFDAGIFWQRNSQLLPCVRTAARLLFRPRTHEERQQCAGGRRPRPSTWTRLPLRARRALGLVDDRPGGRLFISPYSAHGTEVVRVMLSVIELDEQLGRATPSEAAANLALRDNDSSPLYDFSRGSDASSAAIEISPGSLAPSTTSHSVQAAAVPAVRGLAGAGAPSGSLEGAIQPNGSPGEEGNVPFVPFSSRKRDAYRRAGIGGCLAAPDIDSVPPYLGHGRMIRLRLVGIKEQGDPNVPAGRITFTADLGELWLPDPHEAGVPEEKSSRRVKKRRFDDRGAHPASGAGRFDEHTSDASSNAADQQPSAAGDAARSGSSVLSWQSIGFSDKGDLVYHHDAPMLVGRPTPTTFMHLHGLRPRPPPVLPDGMHEVLKWSMRVQPQFQGMALARKIKMPAPGVEGYGEGEGDLYKHMREVATTRPIFQVVDERMSNFFAGHELYNERILTAIKEFEGQSEDMQEYMVRPVQMIARVEAVQSFSNSNKYDSEPVHSSYFDVKRAAEGVIEGTVPVQGHRKYACRLAGQLNAKAGEWDPMWCPGMLQWEEPDEGDERPRNTFQVVWAAPQDKPAHIMSFRALQMLPEESLAVDLDVRVLGRSSSLGGPSTSGAAAAAADTPTQPRSQAQSILNSGFAKDFAREMQAAEKQAALAPGEGCEIGEPSVGCLPWYTLFEQPHRPTQYHTNMFRFMRCYQQWIEPSVRVRPPDPLFSMGKCKGDLAGHVRQLNKVRSTRQLPATNLKGYGDNGTACVARYVGAPFVAAASSGNALSCVPSSPADTHRAVVTATRSLITGARGTGSSGTLMINNGFVGWILRAGIDEANIHGRKDHVDQCKEADEAFEKDCQARYSSEGKTDLGAGEQESESDDAPGDFDEAAGRKFGSDSDAAGEEAKASDSQGGRAGAKSPAGSQKRAALHAVKRLLPHGASRHWRDSRAQSSSRLVGRMIGEAALGVAHARHETAMRVVERALEGESDMGKQACVLALVKLAFRMTTAMHGMFQPLSRSTAATANAQLVQLVLGSDIASAQWSGPAYLWKPSTLVGSAPADTITHERSLYHDLE